MIRALDHLQLAMPPGGEEQAVSFYQAVMADDLPALVRALTAARHPVIVDETRDGRACVYVKDPFGNRIELVEPTFVARTDSIG